MNSRIACIVFAFLLTSGAWAQGEAEAPQEAQEPESPWSGKITFGFLGTSGNTETTSMNTAFGVGYKTGDWEHGLAFNAIQASQSNQNTAEAYELGWNTLWNMSNISFISGRLDWRKDRFAGVPEQFSQTVGYGRRILDTGVHTLNGELGGGARQSEKADGTKDNDVILRGSLDYKWQFSETADFTQDLVVEAGQSNTYIRSVSAVTASLIGNVSLVASYTILNNSDVPAGTKRTDTRTAVALEYAF
jgi:putative salt-induced outer membrane protein